MGDKVNEKLEPSAGSNAPSVTPQGPDAASLTPPNYGIGVVDAAAGKQLQQPAPAASQAAESAEQRERQDIIAGKYADRGTYSLLDRNRTVKENKRQFDRKKGRTVTVDVEREETVLDSTFADAALERARRYLDEHWAPTIDVKRTTGGSGDTKGKKIEMPAWIYEYQDKLAAQKPRDYVAPAWQKNVNPNWNDDSQLAQRLVEAFLRAWHTREQLARDEPIPSNIEQLYERTGASENAYGNAQATILGDPNVYGWCGPASYNAVVLGLMRHGLRFKTKSSTPITADVIEKQKKNEAAFIRNEIKRKNKGIGEEELDQRYRAELAKMAFMAEVNAQAAFFIGNAGKSGAGWIKGDRAVSGEKAYTAPLEPGDVITQALMKDSPVSGHVLTVVEEIRNPDFDGEPGSTISTVHGISGNAGNIGGGSVKIERFIREMPPKSLASNIGMMSNLGNRHTAANARRKDTEAKERARIAGEQKLRPDKVAAEDVARAADATSAADRASLVARLQAKKGQFATAAGMPYEEFVELGKAKVKSQRYYQIAVTQKKLVEEIAFTQRQIRTIDDYKDVPVEADRLKIPTSPTHELYNEPEGKAGKFRPNQPGHMWTYIFIRASKYANAHKIEAELQLDGAAREAKLKELGLDKPLSAAEYEQMILDKHGVERLPGTIESLWPGAIEALEGRPARKQEAKPRPLIETLREKWG